MGLFSVGVALDGVGGVSKDLLHRHECRVCPLNNEVLYNPKMLPTGSSKPLIYLVGEAPGAEEDKEGKQFIGKAGQLLRQYVPKEWLKQIRWNNTIRCRPPKNRDPDEVEIEACRPSIVRDIEATKPQFIFAFGNVPLRWLLGQAGISNWRGRWAPVQIGQHKCWAFFFLHPSYISRKGGKESEEERVFGFDIQNALELIEKWTSGKSFESFKPVVHSAQDARANIECLTGHGPNDFRRVLDWLKYIQNEPEAICGVDYENYPLKPYNNGIILSCAVALRGKTLAWGWHHPQAGWFPEQLEVLDKAWLEFLLSPVRKIVHNCFSGETNIITKNGVKDFRSLSGGAAEIWTGDAWQEAEIKAFGEQELWEIELVPYNRSRSKVKHVIRTTQKHNWVILKKHRKESGRTYWKKESTFITTDGLKVGDQLPSAAPNNRIPNKYSKGFIHGLLFADGSLTSRKHNKEKTLYYHQIRLCGWKSEFSDRFTNIHYPPSARGDPVCYCYKYELNCKELPPEDSPHDYIQDFIEGWSLLDGSTAPGSARIVYTTNEAANKWLRKNAAIGGWLYTGLGIASCKGFSKSEKSVWAIRISKDPTMMWTVKSIKNTRKKDTVFCAVVPNSHKFTLGCGVLTGNCQHEMVWSAHLWGKDVLQNKTWEDTVTQAFVLDERSGVQQGGPLSLGFLVLQYFGINVKYLVNLDKKDLRNEPLEEVLLYNGSDAKYHEALYWKQHFRLRDEQLENQYQDMLRRVRTCALTQLKGIPLDLEENKKQDNELRRAIEELSAEIAASPEAKRFKSNFHQVFEPGSPKRVALMCSMLGFDSQSAKDGKDHTDENYLNSVDHPIARSIVRYRKLVKLRSTYVTSVAEAAYQGVLHHNLNTVFVKTSRTSADGPNMQNWTKHLVEGKIVRRQIIPPPGYAIWSADFAQIQARNIAMESRDPAFCKMLWERYDVHGEWARKLAYAWPDLVGGKRNIKDTAIMKEFRNKIKSGWTFALFFGSHLDNIINNHLHAPRAVLQPLYDEWWETFEGVHKWQQRLIKTYKEQGYVENLTGIRRRAPISENQLINAGIQADEAAVVFDAFNRLSEQDDWNLQPIMEIHDDLQFFFPIGKEDFYAEKVVDELLLINFDWINVPIGIELARSDTNWYDMKPCGEYWSDQWWNEPQRPSYAM